MSLYITACVINIVCQLIISDNIIGRIVKVSDGDTVTLLTEDKKQIKIRLAGIDAPEKGQDFGNKATIFVREVCYNKEVMKIRTRVDKLLKY